MDYPISREVIYKEYVINKKPFRQIAEENGVCRDTVCKYAKIFGIDSRRYAKGEEAYQFTGSGKMSGTVFGRIRRKAMLRGISFEITADDCYELFEKQNRTCKLSGLDIYLPDTGRELGTASLDRIDSKIGYNTDNIQWVHKDVNISKLDLPNDKYKYYCNLIHKYDPNYLDDICYSPEPTLYKNSQGKHKYLRGKLWSRFRYGAKTRNISFDIDIDYGWSLFLLQKGRCWYTGLELLLPKSRSDDMNYNITASLDRLDSSLGYVTGNCVWCHKDINMMKWHFSIGYFKELSTRVAIWNTQNELC